MPIYNPYNEVVAPAKYVSPMDLNLVLKGSMYQQANLEKEHSQNQAAINNILSIPAYGQDKQKLREIAQSLQQDLQGINASNLSTPESRQEIKSIINSYSTNADLVGIAQRGHSYNNMLEEKKDYDKKGKVYYNRGLTQLNKYYSGKDFIQNLPFGNDGYAAPDAGEMMKTVKASLTPDKIWTKQANGQYSLTETYDPAKVKAGFDAIANSDPTWKKYHSDVLEDALDGKNVDEIAKQEYQPLLEQESANLATATFLYANAKTGAEKLKYAQQMQDSQAKVNEAHSVLNNSYNGLAYKQVMLKKQEDADIDQMAKALSFHQDGEIKMDEATKIGLEHVNRISEHKQEKLYDQYAELAPFMSDQDRKNLAQGNLNAIDLKTAMTNKQISDLNVYENKAKIKSEIREKERTEAVKVGTNTFKDDTPISFKDENGTDVSVQYKVLKKDIETGDQLTAKKAVMAILNKKNEGNAQWKPLTLDDVTIIGSGGNRKIKTNTIFGFGGDAVSKTDIININNFFDKGDNNTYDKHPLEIKGYSKEDIESAKKALVANNADTTSANIEQVIKDNKK